MMDAKSKAQEWLNSSSLDDKSRQQIESMRENDLEEAFYKSLEFGTGGLRGIMDIGSNRVNKYTIGMATQGFANYLKNSSSDQVSVAIAYDSRNNSKEFAEITSNVFSANGIKVYLFEDLRPTPELSYAIRHLKCAGGVVLTASHNPKEYNGYKAYWSDGAQLITPHDQNVIDHVNQISSIDDVRFEPNSELIKHIGEELDQRYLEMIKSLTLSGDAIQNQKDLKIVFSPIHGTGITLIPRVLGELGFNNVQVVAEQSTPDGNFPTVIYPNPEEEEAMSMALAKARDLGADLVMATDPDADRVGIAVKNTQGNFQLLNGNQTGVLIVYYLLTKWKERGFKGDEYIVKTIVTTELIKDISENFNIDCYDTLTGFKHIAALIAKLEGERTFIGGGEESYGYMIGGNVRDKDAVASCVIISEMTAWALEQGKSLFEVLVGIYREYGLYYEELKSITRKGIRGAEEINEMMRQFRDNPPKFLAGSEVTTIVDYQSSSKKILETDSIEKLTLPKSNVLQYITRNGSKVSVRPSGTEPKIKFYFSLKSNADWSDYYSEVENLKNKVYKLLIDLGL